jgi:rsbT co-antagonist protein RsbR
VALSARVQAVFGRWRRRLTGDERACDGGRLRGADVIVDGNHPGAGVGVSTEAGLDDTSRSEVLALRERVAALEQELGPMRRAWELLQMVMDHIPQAIFWKDRDSIFLGCNERFARHNGIALPAEIIGKTDRDMPWAECADLYRADDRRVMEADTPKLNYEEPVPLPDGTEGWIRTSKVPLHDDTGAVVAVLGMYEDITVIKRAEAERLRLKEEIIEAQANILADLSTPLIPITDLVMVMPMVGKIDPRRAQQILDTLLAGIAANHARTVILDITGVPVVDADVANFLVRAANAVRLLGAQVMLAGIRPEVARTLVILDIDLGGITTCSTLQRGVAMALAAGR